MADLKPPLTGYSIWFMANRQKQVTLQKLVDDLAKWMGTQGFFSHGTVVGLLDRTGKDEVDILNKAKWLADNTPAFTLELLGVGQRNRFFQSVFLTAAPCPEVVELNQKARKLFNHEADPPYMPHISAVYGDLAGQQKRGAADLISSRLTFPTFIEVETLAVVNNAGFPKDWHIVQSFPLVKK